MFDHDETEKTHSEGAMEVIKRTCTDMATHPTTWILLALCFSTEVVKAVLFCYQIVMMILIAVELGSGVSLFCLTSGWGRSLFRQQLPGESLQFDAAAKKGASS